MRILVLSQYYAPEPISKPVEVARGLKARGHEVTVLTGLPNYPTGRLYPGYRLRPLQREVIDGIPVLRVMLYPSHGSSVAGRILNFCSFMAASVLGALFTGPCDAIYVRHPPSTIGVSAWLIGLMKGAPFVHDVQDIWPESGVWSGMLRHRFLIESVRRVELFVCARAARILVVTEGARRHLVGQGVPAEKVSVASQLLDESMFAAADPARARAIRDEYRLEGRFVVIFTGNIGLVQGLEPVLDAALALKDEPRIAFLLVGDGTERERLARKAAAMGLTNVIFAGRHPEAEMPHFLAAADAALLSLKYAEVCEFSIPLKTFAYLAARRPIVAAIRGAAADLVERAGAGVVVPPEDARALAAAVLGLSRMDADERRRLGEAGRRYMVAHHAKEAMLDEYERFVRTAAAGPGCDQSPRDKGLHK